MTFKTKVMLWLGSVFAAVTAGLPILFFTPASDHAFWGSIVGGSTVFAFLAFSFGTVRWALVAVAGFVPTVLGLTYFRFHASEPGGIGVLAVTVALNALVVWMRLRRRRTGLHA